MFNCAKCYIGIITSIYFHIGITKYCIVAPTGPPTSVKVEAEDQHTLKISWKPPERDEWNGEILGYYVGYKQASSDKPYLFETVEFSKEEGKEHHLQIGELK